MTIIHVIVIIMTTATYRGLPECLFSQRLRLWSERIVGAEPDAGAENNIEVHKRYTKLGPQMDAASINNRAGGAAPPPLGRSRSKNISCFLCLGFLEPFRERLGAQIEKQHPKQHPIANIENGCTFDAKRFPQ